MTVFDLVSKKNKKWKVLIAVGNGPQSMQLYQAAVTVSDFATRYHRRWMDIEYSSSFHRAVEIVP
jgi:hypothetical protein